jgi:hypothetical protein
MTPAYETDPRLPKVVPREEWYASPAVPNGSEPPRQAPESAQIHGEPAAASIEDIKSRGDD